MSELPSPGLLTPEQLAKVYQVSTDTILGWLKKGLIPAEVDAGRIKRFDADAVAAALKANAVKKAKGKSKSGLV
jgi:excisionase family DNA binding protein